MRKFIRRWKYTLTAITFVAGCVTGLFFGPIRWVCAIALVVFFYEFIREGMKYFR